MPAARSYVPPGPPARARQFPSRQLADQRLPLLQSLSHKQRPSPFADLPPDQAAVAADWYAKFCARWSPDLPPWRRGILVGVARRLARRPPPPGFGLSMLQSHRGQASVRSCQRAGIYPGPVAAKRAREWKRKGRPALPSRLLPLD
jgi:hypothetical protein